MQPHEVINIFELNLNPTEFSKFLQILRDLKMNAIDRFTSKQLVIDLIKDAYPLILIIFNQYLDSKNE